jgi:hypothetical protein
MRRQWWMWVLVLLIGAWLRVDGIGSMRDMLQYDEAYYAVDAISLIQQSHLQVFFPANTGREGLWINLLAPAISVWGSQPFTLRIMAWWINVLTIAAIGRLGYVVLKGRGGLWAMLAYSGLFVSVLNSHVAFRVHLWPLIGALAFASLFIASRTHRLRDWVIAGFLLGLQSYTYTGAHGWMAFGVLICGLIWVRDQFVGVRTGQALSLQKIHRHGALLCAAIALLVAAPVLVALLTNRSEGGLARTLITSADELQINVRNWAQAWLGYGDINPNHNIPNASILDPIQAILIVFGLISAWWVVRRRWFIAVIIGLFLLSLLPSVITLRTPQYIRAYGMLVPLALAAGAGALAIERAIVGLWQRIRGNNPHQGHGILRPYGPIRIAAFLLPCLLLFASIVITHNAFHRWLSEYRLVLWIDDRINVPMTWIRDHNPTAQPIVIPGTKAGADPELVHHPVAEVWAYGMGRPLTFFPWPDEPNTCFVTPNQPALYLDLPIVVNQAANRMQPYGTLETLLSAPDDAYHLYAFTPHEDVIGTWDNAAQLGDQLRVQTVGDTRLEAKAGETIRFDLGFRVQTPLTMPYRIFAHLQNEPTPYEGGTLWTTGDAPLCEGAYGPRTPDETLIQALTLTLPADLPAGDYHVAIGVYDPATNTRLPIVHPSGETRFYRAVEIKVK